MKLSDVIMAGVFAIEPADAELTEALGVAMNVDAFIAAVEEGEEALSMVEPQSFLDARRLICEIGDETLPPLFAMAIEFPHEPMWIVRGSVALALIPIKKKDVDKPKRILRSLVAWASTFSPSAAAALVSAAYNLSGSDMEDGTTHLLVDLPLDGISVNRPDGLHIEDWLDELTGATEEGLMKVDEDVEIVLFDSSDDIRTSISGHIAIIWEDDPDDVVALVRDALLYAFSTFTPQEKVQERLMVEIEQECMYTMYADFLTGLEDEDDFFDEDDD